MSKAQEGAARTCPLERNEWDFSRLVKQSPDTQRAAWEWELEREHLRHGRTPLLKLLGYTPPAFATIPWLSLTRGQRREAAQGIKAGAVLEVERKHATALNEALPADEGPGGAKLYRLIICWDGSSLEQVEADLKRLAKNWRKEVRGRHRPRAVSPIAWLWNLSCYRLATLARFDQIQIHEILRNLPAFKERRSAFSPESAKKSVERVEKVIARSPSPRISQRNAAAIVLQPPPAKHVTYKALDGSSCNARVLAPGKTAVRADR